MKKMILMMILLFTMTMTTVSIQARGEGMAIIDYRKVLSLDITGKTQENEKLRKEAEKHLVPLNLFSEVRVCDYADAVTTGEAIYEEAEKKEQNWLEKTWDWIVFWN